MPAQSSPSNDSYTLLVLSLIILTLIPIIVSFNPTAPIWPSWQSVLIGVILITICLLGIVAGASPASCQQSQAIHTTEYHTKPTSQAQPKISKKGHHPTCDHFSAHVFHVNNQTYCAGCTGLIIGATISILGSIGYFLIGFPLPYPDLLFWLGLIGVALGLIQHTLYERLKVKHGSVRVVVNIIFVISAFLTLVTVDYLTKHLIINLLLLSAICYWIYTRIMLSKANHSRICASCKLDDCNLS